MTLRYCVDPEVSGRRKVFGSGAPGNWNDITHDHPDGESEALSVAASRTAGDGLPERLTTTGARVMVAWFVVSVSVTVGAKVIFPVSTGLPSPSNRSQTRLT